MSKTVKIYQEQKIIKSTQNLGKTQKSLIKKWAWWCMPLTTTLGTQRQADLWDQGQPGLQVSSRTARAPRRNSASNNNKSSKKYLRQKKNKQMK